MAGKLTPKQETQRTIEKLGALYAVSKHIGLIAPCKVLAVKDSELAERFRKFGKDLAYGAVFVLIDDNSTSIQKAAAGMLLECFFPEWKSVFPISVVGQVVERESSEVREWRRVVLNTCGQKCARCGCQENLHAHHIVRWADAPALRIDPDNGIALCQSCHIEAHRA